MPGTKPAPIPLRLRRLTPKQWGEIEMLWQAGDATYVDLVEKYKCSVSALQTHFKKFGIVKGSKRAEVLKKAHEALARAEVNDATVLASRIKETKEEHYKMAAALGRLTWAEILQAKKDGNPISIALPNLKALDAAMTILKKAREERYSVLGLDRPDTVDPDEVPELVISELTADQVQQLRDRDHTELDAPPAVQNTEIPAPLDDVEVEGDDA